MREGEQFLHQQDPDLHTTEPIEKTQERLKAKGERTSQKPAEKIEAYLGRIKDILNPPLLKGGEGFDRKERNINMLRSGLYENIVIKPEDVPESAFLLEQKIAREMGHGNVEITQEFKGKKTEQIINDQIQSLDRWIDYLTSVDAYVYPAWAKYWAFTSMVKMGKLEKKEDDQGNEIARFQKRTKDTVSAFPPLNPRAFAMTIGVIMERAAEKVKPKKERKLAENKSVKLDDSQFQELLSTENFSKIYGQFLIEMPEYSKEGLQETSGKWVKYSEGSDPGLLVKSLDGHPLEWCTANTDTARTQLQGGDFYVYYSFSKDDEPENPTIPRLAIRMEGNRIAEPPRGIAPDQNLDPYIVPVLEEKLKEFGQEGEAFKKRTKDMKLLTEIGEKTKNQRELTKEELKFLYEIDGQIDGFGLQKDPRIKELRDKRSIRQDLALIFDYQPDQIGLTINEAFKGNIKLYYGNLSLGNTTSKLEGIEFPESVMGDVLLTNIEKCKNVKLPKLITGNLLLGDLASAKDLIFPKSVGGGLTLSSITSAKGLELPESIGGYIDLGGLTSAKGLKLPKSIGGYLYLVRLTSAKGLKLPKSIGEYLILSGLISAEGLELPESIGGNVVLSGLTTNEKDKIRKKYPKLKIA